jgi:hypothetical protein
LARCLIAPAYLAPTFNEYTDSDSPPDAGHAVSYARKVGTQVGMPVHLVCKCGKEMVAQERHAGRRVQCPACGRALVVPLPEAEVRSGMGWRVDDTPSATARAATVGLLLPGRGSAVLLHAEEPLNDGLTVKGVLTCWYCKADIPFAGEVFGRVGLGGALVTVPCPKCHARIWTGFSTHLAARGTDVFLYAPSPARQYTRKDDEALPTLSFKITDVRKAPAPSATSDADPLTALLANCTRAVSARQPFQEVSEQVGQLVAQPLAPGRAEVVCRTLRALLERESTTYLKIILAEALACLRDESAAPVVRAALRRSLEQEDPGDASNLPLHDLCVLGLLFGDGNGFLDAAKRGMEKLEFTTRARKRGERLTPRGIKALVEQEDSIDCYESKLGGPHWQTVQPLMPLWVDESALKRRAGAGKSWLGRLFGASG